MIYVVDTLPSTIQQTAAALSAEKFSAGWPGNAPATAGDGDPVVVARLLGRWDSLAGGDATSKITLDAYTGKDAAAVSAKLTSLLVSDGNSIGNSKDFAEGNQADGSAYLWICGPSAGISGGIHLPFGALSKGRIVNPGKAYTGGNFVLDEIVLYGFRPIFLLTE
jgi:hypothetical protein